jgi:hypothetical protein
MNLQIAYSEIEKFISKKFQMDIKVEGVGANNTARVSLSGITADLRAAEIKDNDITFELGFEIGKMITSEQATRFTIHLKDIEGLESVLDLLAVKGINFRETGLDLEVDVVE